MVLFNSRLRSKPSAATNNRLVPENNSCCIDQLGRILGHLWTLGPAPRQLDERHLVGGIVAAKTNDQNICKM